MSMMSIAIITLFSSCGWHCISPPSSSLPSFFKTPPDLIFCHSLYLYRSPSSSSTFLGADVAHSGGGESGVGDYPVWNADNSSVARTFGPLGYLFRPREADATIQNPGDAWFWKKNHSFWNASQLWDHYMLTVGRGENFILNMPPDTTGRIPAEYVAETSKFGAALNATLATPLAQVFNQTVTCGTPVVATVPQGQSVTADMIVTREDLSKGQAVASYQLELESGGTWHSVTTALGQTVGNRVYDFLSEPMGHITAVRFTCLTAVRKTVYIRELSLFKSQRPA